MRAWVFVLVVLLGLSLQNTWGQTTYVDDAEKVQAHPRLLLFKGEEKKLKQQINKDAVWKAIHQRLIDEATLTLDKPVNERIKTGKRLLSVSRDNLKRITMINPRTRASTQFDLTIYTNMDLEDRDQAYIANIGTVGQTKWNEAKWSSSSNPIGVKWSTLQSSKVNNQWIANSSVGYKASVVFKTKTKGNAIEWYNTGIIYESGQGIM